MANPVSPTPRLPRPILSRATIETLAQYDAALNSALFRALVEIATRLNLVLPHDGSEDMTGPLVLAPYPKASMPAAASYTGGMIYVTDEAGGAVPAFSDGTNWRRVQDRAVVS